MHRAYSPYFQIGNHPLRHLYRWRPKRTTPWTQRCWKTWRRSSPTVGAGLPRLFLSAEELAIPILMKLTSKLSPQRRCSCHCREDGVERGFDQVKSHGCQIVCPALSGNEGRKEGRKRSSTSAKGVRRDPKSIDLLLVASSYSKRCRSP